MTGKSVQLTSKHRDDFERGGYVVVRNLITAQEVDALVSDYGRAVAGDIDVPGFDGPRAEGPMIQLGNPSQHIPGWQQRPYFSAILAAARFLIGEDVVYWYDQLIYKPPHSPSQTYWHQDAAFWGDDPQQDFRAVTCWLALSRALPENGCMQFIPGSHRGNVQEHRDVSDRSEIANALATDVDPTAAVLCPLVPGDATFHHQRTLHHTAGNTSDVPRRGLITHFSAPNYLDWMRSRAEKN